MPPLLQHVQSPSSYTYKKDQWKGQPCTCLQSCKPSLYLRGGIFNFISGCYWKVKAFSGMMLSYWWWCATSLTSPHCPLEALSRWTRPMPQAKLGEPHCSWGCCSHSLNRSACDFRYFQTKLSRSLDHIFEHTWARKIVWGCILLACSLKQLFRQTWEEILGQKSRCCTSLALLWHFSGLPSRVYSLIVLSTFSAPVDPKHWYSPACRAVTLLMGSVEEPWENT